MNEFTLISTKVGITLWYHIILNEGWQQPNKVSQWRDHHGPTATHLQTKKNTSQTSKQASPICALLAYQCCWLSSAGRVY